MNSIMNNDSCSICIDPIEEEGDKKIKVLKDCGHIFHKTCINEWIVINPTCPLCRTIVKSLSRTIQEPETPTEEMNSLDQWNSRINFETPFLLQRVFLVVGFIFTSFCVIGY